MIRSPCIVLYKKRFDTIRDLGSRIIIKEKNAMDLDRQICRV